MMAPEGVIKITLRNHLINLHLPKSDDQVLLGLHNVHCFLDDILVTGTDDVQHLKNLGVVLHRLEEFGLRVQQEKCEFFKSSLEYLGHTIDAAGLHKSPDKVRAIVDAPAPVNVN
ncbi:hypothetical protein NFI96_019150 [Prochilodus magdalenae]|nr:hypothetical protein NFI96_019150 [Prochilodus magdalenae]